MTPRPNVAAGPAPAIALLVRHAPFAGTTVAISPAIVPQNLLGLSYSINRIVLLPPMVWLSGRTNLRADAAVVAALYPRTLPVLGVISNFALFAYCFYLGVGLLKFL